MAQDQEIKIRKFESRDTQAVRKISFDTAFMGEPAAAFFEGEALFSEALTLYFTGYEPQSCFVAEADSQVIGCLIGAKDKALSEKVFGKKIAPGLFCRALREGTLLKKKNIVFFSRCLLDMIMGKFVAPDFNKEYPATLHINISKGFRGRDIGTDLISAYLDYLKKEGVVGVHLATMSDSAANFFSRLGFNLLHKSSRSYFRHILRKDVPLYIYGRKL